MEEEKTKSKIKIIYEDQNLLVVEKPANIVVFSKNKKEEKTIIEELIKEFPSLKRVGVAPRYGIVHRLDKETSGILLVAKNNASLNFFQKQFQEKNVVKKYIALVVGGLKENFGKIETLIGRSPKNRKKQKVYLPLEPNSTKKRTAITEYNVLKKFKNYTLIEVKPITGRKHQIRCHVAFLGHPIAGDKLYGFKNQPNPEKLKRHFLHAFYLKIKMPNGETKEFISKLPKELKKVIENLENNGC